jgi:plasmid stability protein
MVDILVRNVPDELRAELKMLASAHRRSLSQEVQSLLSKAISSEKSAGAKQFVSAADAFAEMRAQLDMTDEEHREWQEIVDNARKSPDRAVPDFKW